MNQLPCQVHWQRLRIQLFQLYKTCNPIQMHLPFPGRMPAYFYMFRLLVRHIRNRDLIIMVKIIINPFKTVTITFFWIILILLLVMY